MSRPELQYEPSPSARPIVVEHLAGLTRITVAMKRLYVPIPSWIGHLELLALIVAPLWWIGTLLIRTCFRIPNPPRAVFEINATHLTLAIRDQVSGEVTHHKWPLEKLIELRANKFEPGLWVNVVGHSMDNYLPEFSSEVINQLVDALHVAIEADVEIA